MLRHLVTIRKSDNLNKENFWDIASDICPKATALFYEWIDKYKATKLAPVERGIHGFNWDGLFGNTYAGSFQIKFHHLPLEMQVGILFKFFGEYQLSSKLPDGENFFDAGTWIDAICYSFEHIEKILQP